MRLYDELMNPDMQDKYIKPMVKRIMMNMVPYIGIIFAMLFLVSFFGSLGAISIVLYLQTRKQQHS